MLLLLLLLLEYFTFASVDGRIPTPCTPFACSAEQQDRNRRKQGYDRIFLWPDNARSFPPVIEAPAGVGVMRFYDCSNGGGPGVGLMMRRSEFLVRHVSGLMVRSNGALRMAYQHAGCH